MARRQKAPREQSPSIGHPALSVQPTAEAPATASSGGRFARQWNRLCAWFKSFMSKLSEKFTFSKPKKTDVTQMDSFAPHDGDNGDTGSIYSDPHFDERSGMGDAPELEDNLEDNEAVLAVQSTFSSTNLSSTSTDSLSIDEQPVEETASERTTASATKPSSKGK